ncbi:dipeptidase PepV [Floccifex sp.]|uniref:dipeptidase PepV n=1 Tax=Floccifex sp. TaxID=2815810 RepID=UPI003F0760A8
MDFLKYANEKKEQFLSDLNKLVEIESTRDLSTKKEGAPFGNNCRKVLDTCLDMAKQDGFVTKDIDGYAGVIEYGNQKETFGILGHLDVVPLGEGWTKEPLKVTYNDGYIFGRGVMDDKGPALAGYYALKIIKELNIPLKKKVMLIMGCDEESGMECMKYYCQHAQIPDMGFVPDANFPCIYGEKGGLHVGLQSNDATVIQKLVAGQAPNIVIGKADAYVKEMSEQQEQLFHFYCKSNQISGFIQRDELVQIHIDGKSAHAAWPFAGNNAALHLLNFIGSAYNDQLSKDYYSLLKDWMGQPVGIDMEGAYMHYLTMSTGFVTIENGHSHILIDIRYPNDTTGDAIIEKFKTACASLQSDIEVINEGDSKPLFVDPNSKLVTDLMAVYRKYTNDTFHGPMTIGGGTYARHFENFVSYGPEKPWEEVCTNQIVGGCHQADEGIKLSSLIEAIAIYADAIVTLCS